MLHRPGEFATIGFDTPQPLLTTYTAIVEGLQLDIEPGPTPTPSIKQTLGPGPFLSLDEALAQVREREGQEAELLYANLVSEAEARSRTDACSTFLGHPDGVWLLTVRGYFETPSAGRDAKPGRVETPARLVFDRSCGIIRPARTE